LTLKWQCIRESCTEFDYCCNNLYATVRMSRYTRVNLFLKLCCNALHVNYM
jgi:hypothetical protein